MQKRLFRLVLCLAMIALLSGQRAIAKEQEAPGLKMADQSQINSAKWTTVDHSKFKELKKKFTSGDQITKACLSCHTEAADQLHRAIHWQWLSPYDGGYGKGAYSINNFCISTNKMHDLECENCHIGWNGKHDGINCLKCHGQTNMDWRQEFKDLKEAMDSGDPDWVGEIQADIQKDVVKIGLPQRRNCGSCHFNGGGGEGVKHGDLDGSLIRPSRNLDVHMGIDGQNFTCTRCHTTKNHLVAGRVYSTPAMKKHVSLVQNDLAPKIECESCHTSKPHKKNAIGRKLNDHTDRVACQTCHIPTFARAHATQMEWYWETAGKRDKNGKIIQKKGPYGRPVYKSIKGNFVWKKNVKPEYFWYNGSIKSLTAKDVIDPSNQPIWISKPVGSPSDKNSKIAPFKVHRGSQPYDIENNTFVTPLLSEENNGFWSTLDWKDSITRGMKLMGLPYSGKFGFVKTCYVQPTTHMVAPKENAVKCIECHTRNNSRLASITGVYIPGRDRFIPLDMAGWGIAIISLIAIGLHALGRIVFAARRKEDD